MLEKEIIIKKFHQMDMMEIRKRPSHWRWAGKQGYVCKADPAVCGIRWGRTAWPSKLFQPKFPSQAAIYLPSSSDHIILTSEFTLWIDKAAYLRGLEGE